MGRTSDARVRLVTTAMDLICARGYTSVGVQEICARAGVNKGSFYHFFPSKQELALEVIEAYAHQAQEMWEGVMASGRSPLERMERLFDAMYDAQVSRVGTAGWMCGCPVGNLALELSGQDDRIQQKLRDVLDGWSQAVACMLREATSHGDLPALDADTTAQSVIAYVEGAVLLAKTHNNPDILKQLAPGAVHLVEAAAHARLRQLV